MTVYYITITFIILLIIIQLTNKVDSSNLIIQRDYDYFKKFSEKFIISKLINNNKLINPINQKNKILFITYDNRYEEEYISIHNNNIKNYVTLWEYEYVFYNRCNENVYWCKIYMVLDALTKGNYDYVIWMDSDTVIKDFTIDIGSILNKYSSDIYIGSDNNNLYDLINSGVFIIKNSNIGINFLNDCINYVSNKCLNDDGSLKGLWAASCYEQGVMNIIIADKYSNYATILTNNIIFNYNVCSDEVFIMHLYASSSNYRVKCFDLKNRSLNLDST